MKQLRELDGFILCAIKESKNLSDCVKKIYELKKIRISYTDFSSSVVRLQQGELVASKRGWLLPTRLGRKILQGKFFTPPLRWVNAVEAKMAGYAYDERGEVDYLLSKEDYDRAVNQQNG